jgi:N utilization substance protein B
MISRRKARVIAFQALYEWEFTKKDLTDLLQFSWLTNEQPQNDEDLLFPRLIVSGALENLKEIDHHIEIHSKNWQMSRLNKVDLSILRVGVFGLLYLPEIPESVTIDEAVEIAREYGTDKSYQFINGVLDGIRKSKIK